MKYVFRQYVIYKQEGGVQGYTEEAVREITMKLRVFIGDQILRSSLCPSHLKFLNSRTSLIGLFYPRRPAIGHLRVIYTRVDRELLQSSC